MTSPALPVEYETFGVVLVRAVIRGEDDHNAAFALLDHLCQAVLAGEVLPLVVHIVRTVLDLFGKLVQITVFVVHLDTGVRSEYVESAERFDGLRNCRFYLLRIGDVGRNRHR